MSTDEISNHRYSWLLNQFRLRYWGEAEIGEILTPSRQTALAEKPVHVRFLRELKTFERTARSIDSIRVSVFSVWVQLQAGMAASIAVALQVMLWLGYLLHNVSPRDPPAYSELPSRSSLWRRWHMHGA